ncbi:hypothetical protein CAEBREN_26179 [Caenorhabditis brenneri]|uniref:Sdz-33 F-box domain-containing protein n=1 Tax=Caenorhabditis brenneri TaxID=135651 RepID=G0MYJ7_CAEBE|nr:hypothetical protein CAEBREN_26179 [Caenorhabditis brenneri]
MPRRRAFFSPFYSHRIKQYKREKPPNPPESFPFLKLPYFPLKYVINQLELVDVIHFTMKNRRFKRAVECTKFHVDQFHFHLGKWSKRVEVTHQGQSLEIEPDHEENEYESTGLKLNGVVTPICCRPTEMKVFAENAEAKMDVLDEITQHLLSFLCVRTFTAKFLVKCDFENLFIWKYVKNFRKFTIKPVNNTGIVVNSRELHFLLEDIKIEELELDLKVENGYKFPNYPLQGSNIVIHHNHFIDFDKFTIGPDCVKFIMNKHSIPNSCVNRLLKEWIAGKNEKLERLEFKLRDLFEGPNSNEDLLEGITTFENEFEMELRNWGFYDPDLEIPLVDIRRPSDGRSAFIRRWDWYVSLSVRHPNQARRQQRMNV